MEDGVGLLFGDGDAAADEAPVFFDFPHLADVGHGEGGYAVEEGGDKSYRGGVARERRGGHLFFDAEGEEGVVEDAPPNHEVGDLREAAVQPAVVVEGAEVAVVDNMVVEQREDLQEGVQVDLPAILLSSGARMDGDVGQGVVVEDGDEGENLLWRVEPQTHLDAEARFELRQHLVEDGSDFVGEGEDAAAAMLGSDAAHGAADIPVDLGVAHIEEPVGETYEFEGLLTQYLGDDGYGVDVVLRNDVVDFLPCVGQIAMGEGEKWGDGEVESSRVAMVVGFAEEQFGEALHGGKNQHFGLSWFLAASSSRFSMM